MNPIDLLNFYENTPYKILKLEEYQGKSIDSNTLCQKYYTLAEKYHPDAIKVGISEQEMFDTRLKFNTMALAFSILNNLSLKQNYDQLGNIAVDSIFNSNDDSLTSYSKGLWLGVKISVENQRSTITRPNGTTPSFYNIGPPIQKHDRSTPNDITSLVKYNLDSAPALKQSKKSQRNSNQKSKATVSSGDSHFTSSGANKKHYIVKSLNKSPFCGSAVQFSGHSLNGDESTNVHALQHIYHIPDEILNNENIVDNDDYDQERREHFDDEMDQATTYKENELEIEKNDFMDDDDDYDDNDDSVEEEEEEEEEEGDDDDDDINETLSESVPLEFEELAKQTREKQIQRGRELFQKYNNIISHSVLGKREYFPSEREFAAAQERILKNQKENQEKRALKKKKRY
ncbi:hypothetical protein BJ944DRAFT_290205 [Cunninghamella echinulata]|nr:hypothetical protein BJ944DRAFT_290205 [Cunninghamella echinulata]